MSDNSSDGHSLFGPKRPKRHAGICVVVTGQVGLEKKPFLQQVVDIARDNGHEVVLLAAQT
jgi:prephenate dehydrogenase